MERGKGEGKMQIRHRGGGKGWGRKLGRNSQAMEEQCHGIRAGKAGADIHTCKSRLQIWKRVERTTYTRTLAGRRLNADLLRKTNGLPWR